MQPPEIPLDIDHTCKKPWPKPVHDNERMPYNLPQKCPACCYIRGWQDRALKEG